MALTGTLFTGLSGLVVNQTELNVVGNNIANANTTAFKASQATFAPQFYVTDNPGSPINGTSGGSNPSQEGLGAQVSAISVDFTAGSLQSTGVQSDLAIDGNGFFVVNAGNNGQMYTRDGTFSLNSANQLVNAGGDFVQGYGVDSNFNIVGGALQNLTIPIGTSTIAKATENVSLSGTLDAGGVVATTGSQFTSQEIQDASTPGQPVLATSLLTNLQNVSNSLPIYSVGDTVTVAGQQDGRDLPAATFTVTATSTVTELQNFLNGALSIDPAAPTNSGVVPPGTGTPPGAALITDANGFQELQITGNVGQENTITLTGSAMTSTNGGGTVPNGTNALQLTNSGAVANGESAATTIAAFDSLGNPITLNINTVLVGHPAAGGSTWNFTVSSPDNQGGTPILGTGVLTYDTSGKLMSVTGNTITVDRAGTGASPTQQITLDFSNSNALSNAASGAGSSLVSQSEDGFALGTLRDYSIGTNGIITGEYSNGLNETIGQVAVASFDNPDGLVNQGSNLYEAGAASGTAIITTPGLQGTGVIRAGELESSNVDLSKEFINLIIASTGYSASSRVISTSDQLLQELLNSQR